VRKAGNFFAAPFTGQQYRYILPGQPGCNLLCFRRVDNGHHTPATMGQGGNYGAGSSQNIKNHRRTPGQNGLFQAFSCWIKGHTHI
jgi:hypothetical protein